MKNKAYDAGAAIADMANEGADMAKEAASSMADKAKDMASSAAHTASDFAANVGHKAKEAASTVAHKAEDVASKVGHKAEDATTAVGSGMKSLAGTLREKAPHEGLLGSASSAVASTLETSGRYLEEEGLGGIAEELTNLVRRNPIPSVLIGIGLGYLIARATTRS
jgi:hypothetical protein